MAKSCKIHCNIHIHPDKKLSEKLLNDFDKDFVKFFDKENKKLTGIKTKIAKLNKVTLKSKLASLRIGFADDLIEITYRSTDEKKYLLIIDDLLNGIMNFISIYGIETKETLVLFRKTVEINKNPLAKYFDKNNVIEFGNKMGKSLVPGGMVLTTGVIRLSEVEEREFSVTVTDEEGYTEIDMEVETRLEGKLPRDVMKDGDKAINDSRKAIFSALGVKEHR